MATVTLLSTAQTVDTHRDYPLDELQRMQDAAAADRFGLHHCTDDPAAADVVIFVENCSTIEHLLEVRAHPVYRAHREKCFLFARHDYPIPFLPGVYASLPARWHHPARTRTGPYLKAFAHDFLRYDDGHTPRDFLYSFSGKTSTDPIRTALFELDHERQSLFDTSPYWPYGDLSPAERETLHTRYVDTILRSKFVLCPRGQGTSSIRLFESLRMGRPPVIIADDWVPPDGPDWSRCSVRVPEADIHRIPERLEKLEPRAEEMGRAARAVWTHWFSREAVFHRTVESCLAIKRERRLPESLLALSVLPQLAEPLYLRLVLRTLWAAVRTSRR